VRGLLRYRRISAGIIEIEPEWHFGQAIDSPQKQKTTDLGEINSNLIPITFSTKNPQVCA
jgi:hypothetical protein